MYSSSKQSPSPLALARKYVNRPYQTGVDRPLAADPLRRVLDSAVAGVTLAHAFFSLFASYVLRVLTLVKRTLAIGALVSRDSE
ncbi:hypothetical protein BRD22_00805 [Halobacteriales archaeon SW_8_68_21]|nr:MAG: hypothetical protein BRD22_00805 [Halobacteriales archaeon SW_8_68_21]